MKYKEIKPYSNKIPHGKGSPFPWGYRAWSIKEIVLVSGFE